MLNTIIFSKDRACQLEALLRTWTTNVTGVGNLGKTHIIWKASTPDFELGYQKLIDLYSCSKQFNFLKEESFSEQVCELLEICNTATDLVMFLVDDIMFKEPWWLDKELEDLLVMSKEIFCLSLRLSEHINYCYPTSSIVTKPPSYTVLINGYSYGNLAEFEWKHGEGDWGYPMSLDGHVFRASFIRPIVFKLRKYFNNPNSLESVLSETCNRGVFDYLPKMLCYHFNSKIINIPANRVQTTCLNKHNDNLTPEELNKLFVELNQVVDTDKFFKIKNNSPHMNLPLVLHDDPRSDTMYQ
jgi:hypothetical protein